LPGPPRTSTALFAARIAAPPAVPGGFGAGNPNSTPSPPRIWLRAMRSVASTAMMPGAPSCTFVLTLRACDPRSQHSLTCTSERSTSRAAGELTKWVIASMVHRSRVTIDASRTTAAESKKPPELAKIAVTTRSESTTGPSQSSTSNARFACPMKVVDDATSRMPETYTCSPAARPVMRSGSQNPAGEPAPSVV
jgi:hypothetical protein